MEVEQQKEPSALMKVGFSINKQADRGDGGEFRLPDFNPRVLDTELSQSSSHLTAYFIHSFPKILYAFTSRDLRGLLAPFLPMFLFEGKCGDFDSVLGLGRLTKSGAHTACPGIVRIADCSSNNQTNNSSIINYRL